MLFGDARTVRRERVLDGVRECGWGDDHPPLADSSEVDVRIQGNRLEMFDLDPRNLARGWEEVVEKRCREVLAAVRVVGSAFELYRADSLGDTSAHLSVHDRGVDQCSAVFGDEVPLYPDLAGRNIDLDDR